MSALRVAAWIVAVIILVMIFHPLAIRDARPQEAVTIRCVDGICLVPQATLVQLAREAKLARDYAVMCGWGGR